MIIVLAEYEPGLFRCPSGMYYLEAEFEDRHNRADAVVQLTLMRLKAFRAWRIGHKKKVPFWYVPLNIRARWVWNGGYHAQIIGETILVVQDARGRLLPGCKVTVETTLIGHGNGALNDV